MQVAAMVPAQEETFAPRFNISVGARTARTARRCLAHACLHVVAWKQLQRCVLSFKSSRVVVAFDTANQPVP